MSCSLGARPWRSAALRRGSRAMLPRPQAQARVLDRGGHALGELLQDGFVPAAELPGRPARHGERAEHHLSRGERYDEDTASPVATGDLTHHGTPIAPHVGAAEAARRRDHRPVEALAHGRPLLGDHAARAEDALQLEMVAAFGEQGDRREARAAETRGGPHHAGPAGPSAREAAALTSTRSALPSGGIVTYACTGGRRALHGRASSSWAAMRRSRSSRP